MDLRCVCTSSRKLIDAVSRAGAHIWSKDWRPLILFMLFSRHGFSPLYPSWYSLVSPERPLVIVCVWTLTHVVTHEGLWSNFSGKRVPCNHTNSPCPAQALPQRSPLWSQSHMALSWGHGMLASRKGGWLIGFAEGTSGDRFRVKEGVRLSLRVRNREETFWTLVWQKIYS